MLLYQPTPTEITDLMARAAARWPVLASRCAKAADILLNGISPDPDFFLKRGVVRWQISSQCKAGESYSVHANHCLCPDRPPLIVDPIHGSRRFCKHKIAIAAYVRILSTHLQNDIAAGLLELDTPHRIHGTIQAYADRMGIVTLRQDDRGIYLFVGEAAPIHYSIWLARQPHAPQAYANRTALAVE